MTTEERFWAKAEKTETCWPWTAATSRGGYGVFWHDGKLVYAHRFAYQILVGPIPEGLQLDHVKDRGCRHRHCVNPAHLEPVTSAENSRRGDAGRLGAARQKAKTHCPHGHAYDEQNTRIREHGWRECRACRSARKREMRRQQRTQKPTRKGAPHGR